MMDLATCLQSEEDTYPIQGTSDATQAYSLRNVPLK